MADWVHWLVFAGVVVVCELFTGTFYLLMIAIGFTCGALAALAGAGTALQTVVAAGVGVAATLLLRQSRLGNAPAGDAGRDPNVNMDIGQTLAVPKWHDGTARVMYRGALWDVELAAGSSANAGSYKIEEVRGSRLVVASA